MLAVKLLRIMTGLTYNQLQPTHSLVLAVRFVEQEPFVYSRWRRE